VCYLLQMRACRISGFRLLLALNYHPQCHPSIKNTRRLVIDTPKRLISSKPPVSQVSPSTRIWWLSIRNASWKRGGMERMKSDMFYLPSSLLSARKVTAVTVHLTSPSSRHPPAISPLGNPRWAWFVLVLDPPICTKCRHGI